AWTAADAVVVPRRRRRAHQLDEGRLEEDGVAGGLVLDHERRPRADALHRRRWRRGENQLFASCQSSPTPMSTASGGSSGYAPHISSRTSSRIALVSASGTSSS